MRVVLVSKVRLNPYVRLLAQGLAQVPGVQVSTSGTWSLPWLFRQRGRVDVVHLHWLELFYNYPGRVQSLKRWASSVGALLAARPLGIRLVATVHNTSAHEGVSPRLDRWAMRLLYRRAGALHVHDATAADEVVRLGADPKRVNVIPHGTYVGAYPDTCSREEARRWVWQAAGPTSEVSKTSEVLAGTVFLSLGIIRPYKGLEELLAAFAALDVPTARLVIAGQSQVDEYTAELAQLAARDARVSFRPVYVPDEALQYYFRAADVAVLPYKSVTTSGAAYLAFSFGVPIVAPAMGPFVALAQDGRGLLYEPDCPGALAAALQAAKQLDPAQARGACDRFNLEHAWGVLARRHAQMYEELP